MIYTIKNEVLEVAINDLGAELFSIKKDGVEYLWQGDDKFWAGRAINLFPIIGRVYKNQYMYRNNLYTMTQHGFLRHSQLSAVKKSDAEIDFVMTENKDTLKQYPFKFNLTITFLLKGNCLDVKYTVKNTGDDEMIFAIGGHPGFNVPLDGAGGFEDYYLEFNKPTAKRIVLNENTYLSETEENYVFDSGNRINLKHSLFDDDAIILKDSGGEVTLKSDKTNKSVKVNFQKMQYVGFWHTAKKDAPFVCVEPWESLLDYEKPCDFSLKRDMTKLDAGGTYVTGFDIEIN